VLLVVPLSTSYPRVTGFLESDNRSDDRSSKLCYRGLPYSISRHRVAEFSPVT
jgi:hypothetical protein